MELRTLLKICILFGLLYNIQCAKIYIGHSPNTLKFGSAETLRLSELGDVIAAGLGYTTVSGLTWPGLTITSPFGYPLAFVLVNIQSDGQDIQMNGQMYNVKQESSINSVFDFIQSKLNAQSERPLSIQDLSISPSITQLKQSWQPVLITLDKSIIEDGAFIQEMEDLVSVTEKIKKESTIGHGGQDVTFLKIESFNILIEKYGSNSSQAKEANVILIESLKTLENNVRKFYNDRVVFASLFLDEIHHITKRAAFTHSKEDMVDVNLAVPYSEDFPVVFNIVLFLAIILTLAVVASSASMALMDPGHDSIIYRMTNPRMKKD